MIRTQIQLPDPLYREVQRVAKSQDWSLAEVIRRGVEAVVRAYPPNKIHTNWKMPPPLDSKMIVTDAGILRDVLRDDLDHRAD